MSDELSSNDLGAVPTVAPRSVNRNVRCVRHGGWALVDGCVADVVRETLTVRVAAFETARGRTRTRIDEYVLPNALANDSLVVPAGTLPRLLERVSELGYAVEVTDVADDPPAMAPERLSLRRTGERGARLHDALLGSQRGVVRLPRGRRRSEAIHVIALAFPAARIFVACARISDVERLESDLSPEFGRTVLAACGLGWRSDARIVLGTTAALRGCDYREFQVLVFEDGLDAIGDAAVAERRYFDSHSVYAFVEPQARLSVRERLLLDAIAGPDIYAHRREGAVARHLAVEASRATR